MAWHHLALACTCALVACGKGNRAPSSGIDSPENQAAITKLQPYLGCLRDHSARVFRAADAYRSRFAVTPPAAGTAVTLGPIGDPSECLAGLAMASTRTPPMPGVELAAAAFGAALRKVHQLTSSYDPARAAALHSELLAAFTEFDQAQGALFDEVSVVNRKVHVDQLARREQKYGRELFIIAEHLNVVAEDMVRRVAVPADRLEALPVDGLLADVARFEALLTEFASRGDANEDEAESFLGFKDYVDYANAYVVAAKQLAIRARDKVPFSDSERLMIAAGNEASVPGSPAALVRAYNTLVELK